MYVLIPVNGINGLSLLQFVDIIVGKWLSSSTHAVEFDMAITGLFNSYNSICAEVLRQ